MKKTIVLLEDNQESRVGLAALLRSEGHEVVEARHVLEAQAWVAQCETPPDIAVIDVHLPGFRGDEWALYLKELMPETQIVFVSGAPGLAGMDRFGPDARFFRKPFPLNEFLEVINGRSSSRSPDEEETVTMV